MFPAGGGTNLPSSAQLQEAAIALATTAGKYTAVSEELVGVAATALAAGKDLTTQWRGQAPASFLTSLDKLAGDVSNIADALAVSANAMLSLAQAIDAQGGAIVTANQLTAQEPAHPSSAQAQQLSNALTAANAAMGAITSAANAAAGQLDQVKGVGTCSTGKGDTIIKAVARILAAYVVIKAIKDGLSGGGKQPPGPPSPPTGGESPESGAEGSPSWRLKLFRAIKDAIIAGAFNIWLNDGKNYAEDYGQSRLDVIPDMFAHPLYDISSNFHHNFTGTIISVSVGGVAGYFGESLPGSFSIPWTSRTINIGEQIAKHGGAVGTGVGGGIYNSFFGQLPHPIELISRLPGNRVKVRIFENGSYHVEEMSNNALISQLLENGQSLIHVPPGVSLNPTPPSPAPSATTHVVPHPPPG